MLPLRDDTSSSTKPYVVYWLIAVNIFVFILQNLGLLDKFTMIPYSVLHNVRVALEMQYGRPILDHLGNPVFQALPMVGPHPQWITIFTSMFMHGSLMHIGGNMLYLWIFGNNIEDALGHVKFLFFYIFWGVLAAGAHIWSSGSGVSAFIPTLGASGAIAGVLGAYIVLYPKARIDTMLMLGWFWDMIQIPAYYVLGVWFVLQLTGWLGTGGQVGGGVAYWAHIGGFVAGMITMLILGRNRLLRGQQRRMRPSRPDRPYPWRPYK